jgi:hypothetical protein
MLVYELYNKKEILPLKVRVTKLYADTVDEGEDPMLCNIKNVIRDPMTDDGDQESYKLILDFGKYKEHNDSVDSHSYYDSEGNSTLMWSESKHYNNGIVEFYLNGTDNLQDYFVGQ